MISSVSGKRSYPFVSPYTASKHALEAISDSLRRELMLHDIDVIVIEPGPIKTPIWDKAPSVEENPFLGTEYEPALRKFYNEIDMNYLMGDIGNTSLKICKINNKFRIVKTFFFRRST